MRFVRRELKGFVNVFEVDARGRAAHLGLTTRDTHAAIESRVAAGLSDHRQVGFTALGLRAARGGLGCAMTVFDTHLSSSRAASSSAARPPSLF